MNETRKKQAFAPKDCEELWLDLSIEPEQLIRLDPLDITREMVAQAEHLELTDFFLRRLPP